MKSIILTFALIAAVSAGAVSYVKRSDQHDHYNSELVSNSGDYKDYYAHPKYKFEYGVKDVHTGDHKSQWEERDGDVVKGEYTLDEADGTKRIVEYYADGKTGFHANVKKIGHSHH